MPYSGVLFGFRKTTTLVFIIGILYLMSQFQNSLCEVLSDRTLSDPCGTEAMATEEYQPEDVQWSQIINELNDISAKAVQLRIEVPGDNRLPSRMIPSLDASSILDEGTRDASSNNAVAFAKELYHHISGSLVLCMRLIEAQRRHDNGGYANSDRRLVQLEDGMWRSLCLLKTFLDSHGETVSIFEGSFDQLGEMAADTQRYATIYVFANDVRKMMSSMADNTSSLIGQSN